MESTIVKMNYKQHLSKDVRMRRLVSQFDILPLSKEKNIHLELCSSIISQQLSTKVAEVIFGRFLNLFKKRSPSCAEIIAIPFNELKAIGLSESKTRYIQNVCSFFIENKITDTRLQKMEDEVLIDFFSQIKGVGRWTVEMILIFSMGREDVFAVDDLGIQSAMADVYDWKDLDKKKLKEKMVKKAENWRPYRTYACRYLWAWRNNRIKSEKKK